MKTTWKKAMSWGASLRDADSARLLLCVSCLLLVCSGMSLRPASVAADNAFPPLGPAFDVLNARPSSSDSDRRGRDHFRDLQSGAAGAQDGFRRFPIFRSVEPGRSPGLPASRPRSVPRSEPSLEDRLTMRYRNPRVVRFVRSLGVESAVGLFVEVSHLLDSRHLRPASYQDRVHRAFEHLEAAVANPTFGKAVGLASHAGTGLEFRKKLRALSDETRIVSRDDAVSIMRSAMDMAYRELGLHPSAVAVEFVYASTETHDRYSLFRPNRRATGPAAAMGSPVVGVGVEIKTHERGALIVRPIAGGPAAAAGLQAGDLVVAVDGRSLLGLSLEEIGDLITGGAGSRVRLQLDRSGRLRDVILVRRQLVIPTVRDVRLLEGESGIGYLRLDQFSSDSAAEMDRALWSLHRQGMRALVMDLRGNPGGLLSSAIEISDKFLPCGTIVSTRGRLAEDSMLQRAQFSRTWKVPLVVLVDSGSASASEIFAAAIQENRRGLVVGEKSYGKGTVQTEFPLRSVSASLRITTAKFYSPEGRPMAGAGVTPDIAVAAEGMAPGAGQALKVAARAAVGQAVRELARHGGACSNAHPLVGQR